MAVASNFIGEIRFEAEYCPEVIEEWCAISENKHGRRKPSLSLRAKKHLSALGFVFRYVQKGNGRELRYISPSGKCFYSLRTACLSCIDDDGVKSGNRCIEDDGVKSGNLGLIEHHEIPVSGVNLGNLGLFEHQESDVYDVNLGNLGLIEHQESAVSGVNLGNLGLIEHQESAVYDVNLGNLGLIEHQESAVYDVNLGNLGRIEHQERPDYGVNSGNLGRIEHQENAVSHKHCDSTNVPGKIVLALEARRVFESGGKSAGKKRPYGTKKRKFGNCVDGTEVLVEVRRKMFKKKLKKQIIEKEIICKRKVVRQEDHRGTVVALQASKVFLSGSRSGPNELMSEPMIPKREGRIISWKEVREDEGSKDPAKFSKSVTRLGQGKSLSKLMDLKRKACRRTGRSKNLPVSRDVPDNNFNEDSCTVCRYGGELVLCDNCPFAFHCQCLGLTDVPDQDLWFCPSCRCGICGTRESRAENLLRCYQCRRKFHSGCLKRDLAVEDDPGWFCSTMCETVHLSLQNLVGKEIEIKDQNLFLTILKPPMGHKIKVNHKARLRRAVQVLHESFEPSKDPSTGTDLVEDVVFGRRPDKGEAKLSQFYTVVLESNKKVVSAAVVGIYRDLAEVPLVATRMKQRKKGMCRILMDELEKQLMGIGLRRLVLPAAPGLVDYWTGRFGFTKIESSERLQLLHYCFLDFQDTVMCHKDLIKRSDSDKSTLSTL